MTFGETMGSQDLSVWYGCGSGRGRVKEPDSGFWKEPYQEPNGHALQTKQCTQIRLHATARGSTLSSKLKR